jgi:plastocyanin
MRLCLPLCVLALGGLAHADPPKPPLNPVSERAQALREAASLLDKASQARERGNRSYAEQLFSSAELIVGSEALSEIAPTFREGAPPRLKTPLQVLPMTTPPQPPVAAGGSEQDEPDLKPKRGSLNGVLRVDGVALTGVPAVITLEPASGKYRRRMPVHRTVEQRNRDFAPHILAVPTGSTVAFPNFDTIFHNVFSRSETAQFDLGIYRNGQSRELTFDKDGIVRLGCNLHSNMSAYVVVVSQPHYVITDKDGKFSFRSLEPGRYTARIWSERSVPSAHEILVKPEANVLALDVAGRTADAGTDKFGVARGKSP